MNPDILLLSLGVAFEPIPILAEVLLLTAERGRVKGAAFAAGWALAIGAVGLATLVVAGQVTVPPGSGASTASALVDLVLGLALAAWALRTRLMTRSAAGSTTPGWMSRLDHMSPVVAFGLGMLLPPYLLAAGVGNDIVRLDLSISAQIAHVAVFVVVGSLGVLVPLGLALARPARSATVLARWRGWLLDHWPTVLFWLLVVFAAYLSGKGLAESRGLT